MPSRTFVALALVAVGCHASSPASSSASPPLTHAAVSATRPSRPFHGPPLAGHPGLVVEVEGPPRVHFGATSVGLNGSEVSIVVHNVTDAALPLGSIRARFAVRRGGVAFRCEPHDEPLEVSPHVLAPGEAFAFSRMMHCWTPVPGRYDVESQVALQGDTTYAVAGTFVMEVEDDAALGPRTYPGRAGLYIALGGDRRTAPIPMRRALDEEGYHAVIVLANAADTAVAAGPLKLGFLVKKKGSDLTCGGETLARTLPATLASGEVRVLRVPVTCIRESEGEYVVIGQLAFDDPVGADAIEIGRLGVRVTRDLHLLGPSLP